MFCWHSRIAHLVIPSTERALQIRIRNIFAKAKKVYKYSYHAHAQILSLLLLRRSGRQPSAAVYDVLLRHCFDDKRDLPSAHDIVVTMLVDDQITPGPAFVDTLTRMCKRMAANERNRPGLPSGLCGELSKVGLQPPHEPFEHVTHGIKSNLKLIMLILTYYSPEIVSAMPGLVANVGTRHSRVLYMRAHVQLRIHHHDRQLG